MSYASQPSKGLLLTGSGILLSAAIAMAADDRQSTSNDSLAAQHQHLIREGGQASEAVSSSSVLRSNHGIEQISPETALGSASSSKWGEQANQRTQPSLGGPAPLAGQKTACLTKAFPGSVAWQVCVADMGIKGLWIGPVNLQRTPTSKWTTVLYQAGLAEIFVPYHGGTFRPYDLRFSMQLDEVTAQDAGSGMLITLTNETRPTVVAEVRDRGVGWLCKGSNSVATRRAQEFLVWGVQDGGNYDNIIQYGFRDDGTMTFRMGNTGYNKPDLSGEAHMHTGLWRVDMDLDGAGGDSAYLLQHGESLATGLKAVDVKTPLNIAGGRQWNALRFTSLLIEDAGTNKFGKKWGYEFVPMQAGTSRHFGFKESWTFKDFYVTVYNLSNLGWITNWASPDDYLLPDINGSSTNNADLVVWIKASAHHDPIDEDKSINDVSPNSFSGVTLVHWSGFNVEPHNLFDANPLGGPMRCGP
jgi:Copper amine oxidase, enzyme domain